MCCVVSFEVLFYKNKQKIIHHTKQQVDKQDTEMTTSDRPDLELLRTLNIKVEERRERTSPQIADVFFFFFLFLGFSCCRFLWLYEAAGEGAWLHSVHVFELPVGPGGAWNVLVVYSCSLSATVATSSNVDSASFPFIMCCSFFFLFILDGDWLNLLAAFFSHDSEYFHVQLVTLVHEKRRFMENKKFCALGSGGFVCLLVSQFVLVVKDFQTSNRKRDSLSAHTLPCSSTGFTWSLLRHNLHSSDPKGLARH